MDRLDLHRDPFGSFTLLPGVDLYLWLRLVLLALTVVGLAVAAVLLA